MTLEIRINHNPLQCDGKPCIRNMRIRVSDILQMLVEGVSSEEILQDFPDLEQQRSVTGFATPSFTFKNHKTAKRFGRGCKPRPAEGQYFTLIKE